MPAGTGSITSTYTWGNSAAAKNIGRLQSSQISGTGITAYGESYAYDALGRVSQVTYAEGGTNHLVNYDYSATTGALQEITYPVSTAGFRMKVRYDYQNGFAYRVSSGPDQFWIANQTDASGNVTDATLGEVNNGVTLKTLSSFDQINGWLSSRQSTYTSGPVSGAVVANLGFLYDKLGNLIQRQDNQRGLTENFYYDALSRLDYSRLGATTTDYSYDAIGNLTAKAGVGALYDYSSIVPGCAYHPHSQAHAVRRITGGSSTLTFCYDANGNMTNRNGTSISWFADNLPQAITKDGSNSSSFEYAPSGRRWRHTYVTGGSTYTHTYIGNLVEKVVGPSTTDWKHYVYANGEAIGVYLRKTDGTKNRYFLTRDHLGSVAAITRADGAWEVMESFDAFGSRRGASTWTGVPSANDLSKMQLTTRRGFTFHEHLDSTGFVHMNGRVYDPVIGRFISADPIVQAPYFSQSWNRYSYVWNNPLTYTDPTGYCIDGCVIPAWIVNSIFASALGSLFGDRGPSKWILSLRAVVAQLQAYRQAAATPPTPVVGQPVTAPPVATPPSTSPSPTPSPPPTSSPPPTTPPPSNVPQQQPVSASPKHVTETDVVGASSASRGNATSNNSVVTVSAPRRAVTEPPLPVHRPNESGDWYELTAPEGYGYDLGNVDYSKLNPSDTFHQLPQRLVPLDESPLALPTITVNASTGEVVAGRVPEQPVGRSSSESAVPSEPAKPQTIKGMPHSAMPGSRSRIIFDPAQQPEPKAPAAPPELKL